jgi:outer membrane immunogenic protein
MKRVLSVSVGVAAFAVMIGSAVAADLPRREPIYKAPPAYAPPFTWTGHYIGVHLGGLWGKKDWSNTIIGNTSHDLSGFLGGGQIGFNYQTGQWVWGIQGDWAWTNADGSSSCISGTLGATAATCSSDVDWLASVTGRLGYSWDRSLLYVKGGFAWEKDKYTYSVTAPAALARSASPSNTRSGWTLGVGWEYAFQNNWTAFVEYNYYDFGTRTINFATAPATYAVDIKERKHVVKAGINYLFNWYR